ncbi:DUF6518 family protein [Quadrisphaera sp. DSM 44207]|uniref:DUF6518 family protein n=1 Tax=Quadrisphaera sp. DSM 44207 TaxID=1881057 RepID=UPI0008922DB0|nr:DUF6518 family protein [Quadrisphaera sp. DSM 44207]SDQ70555.1 hypothetical protein SAMN05428996_2475 [Quadrisphaera sp. DSM 44207]
MTARRGGAGPVAALCAAAAAGLLLGVLTAFAQGWLPPQVASLANSSGSWALVAFGVAVLAPSARWAACCGFAVLALLLVGYVAANALRGLPSSSGLVLFWGAAALTVGPLLGLGGHWLRRRRDLLAALGAGGMSGVLVGEGAYGLRYVAATTYPPYWWASIAAGVVLLAVALAARLRRPRVRAAAVLVAVLVSVAFVLAYANAGAVIGAL